MSVLNVACPRCGAKVGEKCHDASGYGVPHRDRDVAWTAVDGVLILFSGGMDSTLLVKRAVEHGRRVVPLFVDYGQPHHSQERAAAQGFCDAHNIDLRAVERGLHGGLVKGGSPVVPGRNLALVSYAANRAAAENCSEVQIGCCAADAETFEDCRPNYIETLAKLVRPINLTAPLIFTTKTEIREELGGSLSATWSCYHPTNGKPCGECGACVARGAA